MSDKGVKVVPVMEGQKVTVGRSPRSDIITRDPWASRRHCTIEEVGGSYKLSDCDSRNGTLVNGRRVEQVLLQDEDIIELGASKIKFIAPERVERRVKRP